MKKQLFILGIVGLFCLPTQAQNYFTNLLSDSMHIDSNKPRYCSDGDKVFAFCRTSSSEYKFFKKDGNNYTVISDLPYGSEHFCKNLVVIEGDCYHLTSRGAYIYKQDGTWDSLLVDGALQRVYGVFKDDNKWYVRLGNKLAVKVEDTWTFYPFSNDKSMNSSVNSYGTKFVKNNGLIYFNVKNKGLFVFDGNNLTKIVDRRVISYDILNHKIYYSINTSQIDYILVCDTLGNPIDEECIATGRAISKKDDELKILGGSSSSNYISYISNDASARLRTDFKLIGNKLESYNDGFLVAGELNNKQSLWYFDVDAVDYFGAIQTDKSYRNLDVNQVNAYYRNRGQMFWDGIGEAKYEVPKGSGKIASFAGGLWFSGISSTVGEDDYLGVAAVKFNAEGYDFSPGPLKVSGAEQGTVGLSYARNFDRIWKISKEDIIYHLSHYQENGYVMSEEIETWPAHGDTTAGYAKYLAPFIDVNDNGIYEPMQGDYPCVKGDMALYWIFNDNLTEHEETGGNPLKIEVHAQAYAFNCDTCSGEDTVLNYTTFLNWKVFNRSQKDYSQFASSFWSDADLGYAFDDYIGTHVGLNSMYIYNGKDLDGTGNGHEYGENPPALFHTMLDGPVATLNDGIDNNNNGVIDEEGEKILLSSSMYFNNDASVQGDPILAQQYYNYMHSRWKDGRPLSFGGTGYVVEGGISCKYMFPGNSDPWLNGTMGVDPNYTKDGGWTEENEGNEPYDRRLLASVGSVDFPSGGVLEYTMALVWSRANGGGAFASVEKGFDDVQLITDLYNNTSMHECDYLSLDVEEPQADNVISIYPNPSSGLVYVKGIEEGDVCKIYSIDGALLKTFRYNNKPISIKHFPNGIYLMDVQSRKYKQQFKLIKQ